MQTDREAHTSCGCSSEGRAFVPGSRFVLVLLCFTVQAYISKQPHEQLLSKWTPGCSLKHAHTQTHIHVGIRLEMLINCVHTKQKPPSLDIFRRLSYQCACPQQRRHRRMFPCPWWLSDEGHRWGLKGRGGRDGE